MALGVTRRSFLGSSSTAVLTALAGSGGLAASPPPGDGERYWEMVRKQFAFDDAKIPMNAANLCPSSRVVEEAVRELAHDIDVDCSSHNRAKFSRLLELSRGKVAAQLRVSPDEVALVRNTSEANNIINNGLDLRPGDEVLVWDQNHPTNNVAWDVRAARFGLAVRRIATPTKPSGLDELVKVIERSFGERTRILAITHVSNVSGLRLPVRELCEAARKRGIYVHVDGAQSWGALDVDLDSLGCDSYSASAHKWFLGPREVGLLYVRRDRISEIWPNSVAPGWGEDQETDLVGARKFESLGQRDDARLAAIATAADFLTGIGHKRVEARITELASHLKAGILDQGLSLVTPSAPGLSAGVCVISAPEEIRRTLVNRMYDDYGIAAAVTGGLRLCPHIYNTEEHIERALAAVRELRPLISKARR